MNAWLKRCVFNLDLNRESVSEPRTLSGRLFQRLGAKYEKVLPPLVDFAILGTIKSPEFCDLREPSHPWHTERVCSSFLKILKIRFFFNVCFVCLK